MNSRKNAIEKIIKYVLLCLCVMFLYVLQGTPGFLSIWGVKPVFIIPFCINLAALEEENYKYIVYVVAGLFMELSAGRIIGYYTIPVIIACTICSFIVKILIKPNYRNTVAMAFVSTFMILLTDFFFSYILSGYKGVFIIFFKTVLLSSCYSMAFSVLYYKIIAAIQKKFISFNAR
ncbi:MAG: hypothetical protein E7484_05525 [Ruminococcaceae bacterium]|nr:hypothetical protein [Oscillospiraceae bacterium]